MTGASDDEDDDGEVLQMKKIAPSATAPHLERIDERTSMGSESSFRNNARFPRSASSVPTSPVAPEDEELEMTAFVEPQPDVPLYTHRPRIDPANSASSEVQSPRPDYHPESTPLLSKR